MKNLHRTLLMAATAALFTTAISSGAHADNYEDQNSQMQDGTMNQPQQYDSDVRLNDMDSQAEKNNSQRTQQGSMLNSSKVKEIQQSLKDEGHNLTVDGQMGPKTVEAVRAFQEKNDLEATGNLDSQTLSALDIDLEQYRN